MWCVLGGPSVKNLPAIQHFWAEWERLPEKKRHTLQEVVAQSSWDAQHLQRPDDRSYRWYDYKASPRAQSWNIAPAPPVAPT